jgi:radical SAM protein with 4Fe4S-binding SPASM domain
MTTTDLQSFAQELVESTRDYIYIRPQDGLIILRPNKVANLNPTAKEMLGRLYAGDQVPDVYQMIAEIAARYEVDASRVEGDLLDLLRSVAALLNDRLAGAPSVVSTPFRSHQRDLPVLSEIALTYRCQNRCTFCYASAPDRGPDVPEMDTAQVKVILDRIMDEAHCPTVSFTGGEPTLRRDLPELIAYGKAKGMRVNLITNGLRCASADYVNTLADAGLDSAQVSLEGPTAEIHDAITQHPGAFARTTQAVHTLRQAGIHTHTNTTICGGNRKHLLDLVDYIADELGSEYFSMNMVIRTGTALDHPEDDITYSEIGDCITAIQTRAQAKEIRLVWYSPIPYCHFNPIVHGLGSKSCACVDGLLSVNPAGELLPCSSYERGIGSLLEKPFEQVWFSRTALYWRRKEFVPPQCQRCEIKAICCGACPLYWDERGGFEELAGKAPAPAPWHHLMWSIKKQLWSGTRGVGLQGRENMSAKGAK